MRRKGFIKDWFLSLLEAVKKLLLFDIKTIKVLRVVRKKAVSLFPAAIKAVICNQIFLIEIKMRLD